VILVDASAVSASRPTKRLFDEVSVTISSGERLAIVGINGTGKSTLLRVLAGTGTPESGTVRFGRDVRVSMLEQDPRLSGGTVSTGAGGTWESDAILDKLGMGSMLDTPVEQLSGGQAKRVALAKALVTPADLLILDEPTNHLDIDAIAWLEDRLASWTGGLVLVTHDRHVLDRVTNRILELDRGAGHLHDGGYQSYLDAKAVREEQAATSEQVRRNLAKTELAWLRRGAPARTAKPKARIATATAIVEGRAEAAARTGELDLHRDVPRLGDVVVELEGVGHRWTPDSPWLLHDVELRLDPRERLGVVGVNGTGKSTLLELMAKRIVPEVGEVRWGSTVRLATYDQHGSQMDGTLRVREAIAGPNRPPDYRDAALAESFWFDGDAQWAPISSLSGGERRRLQLVLTLAEQPNVLLLDEPTNDLDLDTLRALEDFLETWPGALVVVSHDRAFLERVVADVVVLDGTGTVGRRPGGYAGWEEERRGGRRRRGGSMTLAEPEAPARASGGGGATAAGGGDKSASPSTLRHRLRSAERDMATIQKEHDQLVSELAVLTDHVQLAEVSRRLAGVLERLSVAEEAWLTAAAEVEDRGLES